MFRYRTSDLAEILSAETGEDGLKRMRFRIRGRTDQMLVLKGVNFFPKSLMSVVAEFPEHWVAPIASYGRGRPGGPYRGRDRDAGPPNAGLAPRDRAAHQRPASNAHASAWFPWYAPREANKTRYIVESFSAIPGVVGHLGTKVAG